MPLPLIPIITAGASLASQGINAALTSYQNQQSRKWAEKQYKIQRADALADWNRQNEYNDPSKQLERLRNAGLNPNLFYSGGNVGQAAQVQQAHMQSPQFQAPQFDLGGTLQQYYQVQQAEKNLSLTDEQIKLNKATQMLKSAEYYSKLTDNEQKKFDLFMSKNMAEYDLQLKDQEVKLGDQKLRKYFTENEILEATKANTITAAVLKVLTMRKNNIIQELQAQSLRVKTDKDRQQIENLKKAAEYLDEQIALMPTKKSLLEGEAELLSGGITKNDPAWMRMFSSEINEVMRGMKGLYNSSPMHKWLSSENQTYSPNIPRTGGRKK